MVRLTDCLDMTIAVDWDMKPQTKQTNSVHSKWTAPKCEAVSPLKDERVNMYLQIAYNGAII